MAVYTDSPQFAAAFLSPKVAGELAPMDRPDQSMIPLLPGIFGHTEELLRAPFAQGDLPFPHLLLSEFAPGSNYDQLIELARGKDPLPDGVACLAGSGSEFHGFKGRSWAAVPGNIHLALHLAPRREMDRFGIAFTILAALSVVDALGHIAGLEGRARIKWVNDILLEDAKIGGILAYTQSQGRIVSSAVLGIGVNVEATPVVEPTPFVPRVTSVRDFLPTSGPDLRERTFRSLLRALDENYRTLLTDGVSPLLERYRECSMVLGEKVTVCTDSSDGTLEVVTQGRVMALGDDLELVVEGCPEPVRAGRLVLGR